MTRTINTLTKAITILETIVANQAAGLTLTEIVERTGTPKSSTHRILSNLITMITLIWTKKPANFGEP